MNNLKLRPRFLKKIQEIFNGWTKTVLLPFRNC